jgi:hypothetical protein
LDFSRKDLSLSNYIDKAVIAQATWEGKTMLEKVLDESYEAICGGEVDVPLVHD